MKIYFYGRGDKSVGINPVAATLEVNLFSDNFDKEERKVIVCELSKLIGELFDDSMAGHFEDRCFDCGSELEKFKRKEGYKACKNKDCINNSHFLRR